MTCRIAADASEAACFSGSVDLLGIVFSSLGRPKDFLHFNRIVAGIRLQQERVAAGWEAMAAANGCH